MNKIHPELVDEFFEPNVKAGLKIWNRVRTDRPWESIYHYLDVLKEKASVATGSDMANAGLFTGMLLSPFDELSDKDEPGNFERFMSNSLTRVFLDAISNKLVGTSDAIPNMMMPALLARMMRKAIKAYGDRCYQVAPDLAWALEHTELRKFPANELRLPVPCLFVEMPYGYQVYNDMTGWHECSGVYISEYVTLRRRGTRCWRVLLVGKSKSDEPMDDALAHYTILLSDDGHAYKCAVESIYRGHADTEVGKGKGWLDRLDGDVEKKVEALTLEKAAKKQMSDLDKEFLRIFSFLMNLVIYITRPDADVIMSDASPEYNSMRDRMIKAQGKKREKIKSRMRGTKQRPRLLVGSRIVIDRKRQASESKGDGKRKQTVRSIVSGHWKRAGKEKKKIWIVPYYRGPEHAPLTAKTKVKVK